MFAKNFTCLIIEPFAEFLLNLLLGQSALSYAFLQVLFHHDALVRQNCTTGVCWLCAFH
jgi:hypothetical protein